MCAQTESLRQVWGPLRSPERAGFVAFVIVGTYAGATRRVCLVAPDTAEDVEKLTRNFDMLFENVLDDVSRRLEGWEKFCAFSGLLQEGGTRMSTNAYLGSEIDPERLAAETLAGRQR